MSALPGTSVLLTENDFEYPREERTARKPRASQLTPPRVSDDRERELLARAAGRPEILCHACGRPTTDRPRTTRSGLPYCETCADRLVAAYDRAHPAARAAREASGPPRERTGTAYLRERERYEARRHAGNGRWQIADGQTRRWTDHHHATEAGARAIAIVLNAQWREQVGLEHQPLGERWAAGGEEGGTVEEADLS